jgi:hypothetical protein
MLFFAVSQPLKFPLLRHLKGVFPASQLLDLSASFFKGERFENILAMLNSMEMKAEKFCFNR